jgi:hypothetical protein
MKKVLFLMFMLFLIVSGTANLKAQVRIGGSADPNPSAVLDLNATNTANNGNLGLALPRVELTSTTGFAPLKAHVAGMMVYNTTTNGEVTPGTYYNTGSEWVRIGSGSLISEVDGVIGNEVTTATADGGLTRAGSGTAADPFTLGIDMGGVTTTRIVNGAVTKDKLNQMGAEAGQVLRYGTGGWSPSRLTVDEIGGCVKQVIYISEDVPRVPHTVTHASVDPNKSFVLLSTRGTETFFILERTPTTITLGNTSDHTIYSAHAYAQLVEFY